MHEILPYKLGSLKAECAVEGNQEFDQVAAELDVPFKRTSKVVVGFDAHDTKNLLKFKEIGEKNGVRGMRIINKEEMNQLDSSAGGEFAMNVPDFYVTEDREDYKVTKEHMDGLILDGQKMFRHMKRKYFIMLESDEKNTNTVNLVGTESPGITCALPLAKRAVKRRRLRLQKIRIMAKWYAAVRMLHGRRFFRPFTIRWGFIR